MRFLTVLRRSGERAVADKLYRIIVEQSRLPVFYSELGVRDTPDGRYDMIIAHMILVLRRLKGAPSETRELAQALFDLMFADMDQNLREMGVGDLAVGKRVKNMAKAFYGRLAAYDAALCADDSSALQAALSRNLFRNSKPTRQQVADVAVYLRRQADHLDRQSLDSLVSGRFRFGTAPSVREEHAQ